MRVGVIGASGKAGSLIIAEAKNRGHDVTAIVRDASKVAGLGYRIIEKDLFDLTADDLRDFDAVVSAFGTPFGQNREAEHQRAMEHLISVFEKLPDVRLLVVGGAGSLRRGGSHFTVRPLCECLHVCADLCVGTPQHSLARTRSRMALNTLKVSNQFTRKQKKGPLRERA